MFSLFSSEQCKKKFDTIRKEVTRRLASQAPYEVSLARQLEIVDNNVTDPRAREAIKAVVIAGYNLAQRESKGGHHE